ncbi:MAG: type II toxin-antitoxin system VapC family toxin [Promethearchaeati archaeon SRVP18_Atabeyarchaeia-1]
MTLSKELSRVNRLFIDTPPVIYYIEAHPQFGPLVKEIVDLFQSDGAVAFSSVLTLTEVLSKPIEAGDENLARKFAEFLKYGKNLGLIEISVDVAERAGRLRGQYPDLRTVDAVQISAAIGIGADAFVTNDKKLKRIKELNVIVLSDYL